MSDPIITVENLGKKYRLDHQVERRRYATLRDVIADRAKRLCRAPFRGAHGPNSSGRTEEFWALKDVSFDVRQGEVIGIVGCNGAGKSTLLKVLSRITEPTTGRLRLRGRVASLLEVGTGFHPELTGRENIFLNGAILSMTRAEIRQKFDEIVAFAEIEKFLDTPIKRYSSGMYVRLAFAVAAHLAHQILIIDEVLAVGDEQFQRKCIGKMQEVATDGGRTILFVSHNMSVVARLCNRSILLNCGSVEAIGATESIVEQYQRSIPNQRATFSPAQRAGNIAEQQCASLLSAAIIVRGSELQAACSHDDEIMIRIRFRVNRQAYGLRIGFRLHTHDGSVLLTSTMSDQWVAGHRLSCLEPALYTSECRLPARFLNNGQYSVTITSDVPNREVCFLYEQALAFSVAPGLGSIHNLADGRLGPICSLLPWKTVSETVSYEH